MISYGLSINSPVLPCDESAFNAIVDSPRVAELCSQIAAELDHKKQGVMKRGLPFFCFHASFKGKRRIAKDAIPSGFAMIDVDGIEDPRKVWDEIEPRKEELDIVLAHITPSTKGLRLVLPTTPSQPPRGEEMKDREVNGLEIDLKEAQERIVETQKRIVRELKLDNVDCVVKDLARCSFAVPRSYILHLDKRLFSPLTHSPLTHSPLTPEGGTLDSNEREKDITETPSPSNVTKHSPVGGDGGGSLGGDGGGSLGEDGGGLYNGILYSDIIKAWLSLYLRQKPGYRTFEAPAEGDRNNTLYDLCKDIRNICDYSFQKILDVVPNFGLDRGEVEQTVLSALKADRRTPYILNKVLRETHPDPPKGRGEEGVEGDDCGNNGRELEDFNEGYLEQLPDLPPMMKSVLSGADRKFHMPILVGMLPMLCSYADKVVFRYADGRWRRPNMMSFIIGPPMSGKSAVTTQLATLLEPMKRESQAVRDLQDEARRNNNERSDKERGKTFASFIKKLNMDITDAELLYNQKAATKAGKEVEGHFLPKKQFMFTEEAGVVMKAAKNDKLTSAWRCAFDNGEWGKDVHADNAVSGEVHLSFDFTALCTMGVLQKLLDPTNIENGTASRMLLGLMPATNYERMPWFDEKKAKDCDIINETVERISAMELAIDSKPLIKAITKWSNDMAEECKANNDLDRDMLRRRAGIIGQTAAVIFALVENKQAKGSLAITKKAISFGLVFADYALETQCQIFKDYAATASLKISLSGDRKMTKNKVLFDSLPDEFTYNDIVVVKKGKKAAAIMFLRRLMEKGLIVKNDNLSYKKVTYEDYNRKKIQEGELHDR